MININELAERANRIVLIPIETRSRTKMFRVERAGKHLGILEKMPQSGGDITPWKAFLGMGHNIKYLSFFYGRNGKQEAIDCIVRAYAGIFVGTEIAK